MRRLLEHGSYLYCLKHPFWIAKWILAMLMKSHVWNSKSQMCCLNAHVVVEIRRVCSVSTRCLLKQKAPVIIII